MGCLLGLWAGYSSLHFPLPHVPGGRAWNALGSELPRTYTHEKWGEKKRQKRMENIPYARDVTRKCKIGVTNSEKQHEKL